MSADIQWGDPPSSVHAGRARTNWREITEALKDRPGEWALVSEDSFVGTAAQLRRQFPEFEFTCRRLPDTNGRRSAVYARFVGGESA